MDEKTKKIRPIEYTIKKGNTFKNRISEYFRKRDKEKKKKITMWWNLPPEELDEVIEANDGKLEPFAHVEEQEKK
jgi:hypothetical protein